MSEHLCRHVFFMVLFLKVLLKKHKQNIQYIDDVQYESLLHIFLNFELNYSKFYAKNKSYALVTS